MCEDEDQQQGFGFLHHAPCTMPFVSLTVVVFRTRPLALNTAVWRPLTTKAAFDKLDSIYGTYTEKSDVKTGFQLPRHCMTNTDLNRIINSDEVLRPHRIRC